MNENAKKWVAALRSGEYPQARGALKKAAGYCCLGVACQVYLAEHPDDYLVSERLKDGFNLPPVVKRWLGLVGPEGAYNGSCLSADNDQGMTFEWIADIIESEPEGLFT